MTVKWTSSYCGYVFEQNVMSKMTEGNRHEILAASKDTKVTDLKAAIIQRKAAEAKALAIVHNLTEDPVSTEQLLKACMEISREHYDDIVQERAIDLRCGYPLCTNRIQSPFKTPTKKYHISLKYNKVFDISERKLFCSNHCFKASKYLDSQLDSSQDWLREDGRIASEISLYNADVRVETFMETEVDLEQLSLTTGSSESDIEIRSVKGDLINEDQPVLRESKTVRGRAGEPSSKHGSTEPTESRVIVKPKERSSDSVGLTLLVLIEKNLKEWFTAESVQFLVKQKVPRDDEGTAQSSVASKEIRKRSDYELRVQRFYGEMDETPCTKLDGITERNIDDGERKPVLPLVDSRAQKEIRRRIVLDRLNVVSSELIRAMSLSSSEVKRDLRQLIHTFRLNAKNISMKPAEWTVVVLVLMHLLSIRNGTVRDAFEGESSKQYLTTLLKCFGQDLAYLQRVTDWLINGHK